MTTTPDPTRLCAECGHAKNFHFIEDGCWHADDEDFFCPCPEFKESDE